MYYRGAQAAIIVYDITSQVLCAEMAEFSIVLWMTLVVSSVRLVGCKDCKVPSQCHPHLHIDYGLAIQFIHTFLCQQVCTFHCHVAFDHYLWTVSVLLQDSFVRAKSWVKELQRLANTNILIPLAGNKADLASKRTVEFEVTCIIIIACFAFGTV